MHRTRLHAPIKTISCAVLGITLLSAANAYAAVSQSPLSLTVGVPPNMILTLDDSGSMRWAFVPDGGGDRATRRVKSSAFNPMYYNPAVTYVVPPRYSANGERYTPTTAETPTFTNALNNGFKPANGAYNLATDYRVTWSYDPTGAMSGDTAYGYSNTSNRFAENPSSDFQASASISTNNASATVTKGPITYKIVRTGSNSCTATVSYANSSSNLPANCTDSSGKFTVDLRTAVSTGEQDFSSGSKTVSTNGLTFTITRTGTRSCTATVSTTGGSQNAAAQCHSPSKNRYVATYSGVPAYYYTHNGGNCGINDENCYTLHFVSAAEQQNFANWYSFYRNRALATISAASIAFSELPNSTRLTWQGLGTCKTLNSTDSCNSGNNLFREYDLTQRGRLFSWMQNMGFSSSTPLPAALKRAGEFLKTSDVPWQKFPNGTGNTAENTYACRPSYHILMTDGMWNETVADPASFRTDHSSFVLPDGTDYNGSVKPYADPTDRTLADLAMHYWATDLRPSLDNKLPAYMPFKSGDSNTDYWDPRNNPATWQHMVNFTVGLGLTQSLKQSGVEWDPTRGTFGGTGYDNLKNGTKSWPAASSRSDNNVYDLWHAAINSRGEFFSVDSPEAMVQAFANILSRIADRTATAARPAINSGQVSADEGENGTVKTVSYQTSYSSADNWAGDVKRFEKAWNAQSNVFETTEIWSAKSKVPAWSNRTIKMAGNNNSGLQDFSWANAGSAETEGTLAYWLSRNPETGVSDGLGQQRLEYLRGNRTGEGTTFRRRSSVLGDFYSSSPAVVSGPRYLINISNQLEGNTAYTTFAQSIANRPPRVYVGANDGMLHGFNAVTGVEEFAFIPSAVLHKLNKLTGTNYSHEFYVDGSPVVADVYDGTQWRTILVGTLKAGGKSIFALDITTPGSEKLLWEFDDSSLPENAAVKMGYSFSQPTIARLHTGKWAVVFGNGYESANHTNGKAALFIVDAIKGTLLKSLEVQGTNGVANGLSTPKLADYNADGVADYAYAGDLQGNLWRFDLLRNGRSESTPFTTEDDGESALNDFEVAFGGHPLFSAHATGDTDKRQPITAAPSLVRHPNGIGYLVIFGTGKFFETGDKDGDKSMAQTVYGIWDKQTKGENASNPNISRDKLQMQEILSQITVQADGTTRQGRTISDYTVDWTTQNGWYLDLKDDGEMVVENMSQLGRTIFMQSLVPNDDPCGDGATNWTYALNPFTGGKTLQRAFDYVPTSGSGTVSAIRQDGEGGGTITQNSDSSFEFCTGQECVGIYPDPASMGRQSWRRLEEQK